MKLHFNGSILAWKIGCQHGWIGADCQVRNELNGERPLHDPDQVVYAETGNRYDKIPYMPRRFPEGTWPIGMPRSKPPEDEYLWPWYIPTDAWQYVDTWLLDEDGGYECAEENALNESVVEFFPVIDTAYGMHYSKSRTTLGCIHVLAETDIRALTLMVFRELRAGHKNIIEVKYED